MLENESPRSISNLKMYYLQHVFSGLFLTPEQMSPICQTQLVGWPFQGRGPGYDSQLWAEASDGLFINCATRHTLELLDGATSDGTPVVQGLPAAGAAADCQRWFSNGMGQLSSFADPHLVLTLVAPRPGTHAVARLQVDSPLPDTVWRLIPAVQRDLRFPQAASQPDNIRRGGASVRLLEDTPPTHRSRACRHDF